MPVDHHERAFEEAIEHHLTTEAGHDKADLASFGCTQSIGRPRKYLCPLISAAVTRKIKVIGEATG